MSATLTNRLALAAIAWTLCGGAESHLISRTPGDPPLLGPLPSRLQPARMTTSDQLRSLGIYLPGFPRLKAEFCRDVPGVRDAWIDGLRRALAEPQRPKEDAVSGRAEDGYLEVAWACGAEACAWFRERIEQTPGPERLSLWRALAACHPVDQPEIFEREDAPAAASIGFYSRRGQPTGTHSPRLHALVQSAFDRRDIEGLKAALSPYKVTDHPETARHLLALHAVSADPELNRMFAYAMRNQSDPVAAKTFTERCERDLQISLDHWRAKGGNPRASPTRFGRPCARHLADRSAFGARPYSSEPKPSDPLSQFPSELGKPVRLISEPGWQFADHSILLWRIAELVSPILDDATFEDRWPAVDRVSIHRGPLPIGVFLNGDRVLLHVGELNGEPDHAMAAEIRDELVAALQEERQMAVWLRGEQFLFRYQPEADRHDLEAIFEIINTLLRTVNTEKRIARVRTPHGLAVLFGNRDQIAQAAREGWLQP